MMNITENMVLGLLKKGMTYELKNADMEMEIPIGTLMTGEDNMFGSRLKVTCKVESCILTITQD